MHPAAAAAAANLPSRIFDAHKVVPCTEPRSPPPLGPEEGLDGNGHFVKIVVSKEQLESMLRNGEDVAYIREIAVRFLSEKPPRAEEGCSRWRPSLATIPEVQKF